MRIPLPSSVKDLLKKHPAVHALGSAVRRLLGEYWEDDFLLLLDGHQDHVTFVQVGAHDGLTDDFVHPFAMMPNWFGILVEPDPDNFAALRRNYAGVENVVFENVAIGDHDGEVTFYRVRKPEGVDYPDEVTMLCSLDRDVILKRKHTTAFPGLEDLIEETTVPCVTLDRLLRKHGIARIDAVICDTEGYDADILRQLDLDSWKPKVVIYETMHLERPVREGLIERWRAAGYGYFESSGNAVAYRPEIMRRWIVRPHPKHVAPSRRSGG